MLSELATSDAARMTEFRSRKGRYAQQTFRRDEADYAVSEGWELLRENQNTLRYQKLKSHDVQLENEFWCLLYHFGYPNLNIGRNFQIEITTTGRTTVSKQIDVFAYDDETVTSSKSPDRIVAEESNLAADAKSSSPSKTVSLVPLGTLNLPLRFSR